MSSFARAYARPGKPEPKRTIIEHWCACGAEACFCLGPPMQPEQWFCPACRPADFYTRGGRR